MFSLSAGYSVYAWEHRIIFAILVSKRLRSWLFFFKAKSQRCNRVPVCVVCLKTGSLVVAFILMIMALIMMMFILMIVGLFNVIKRLHVGYDDVDQA